MNNYFLLSNKNMPQVASAFAPMGTKLSHELIDDLDGVDKLPFDLELFKLSDGKKGLVKNDDLNDLKQIWLDYQPNSLAWPLFSEGFKVKIDSCLTGNEGIDWIAAIIRSEKEHKIYYIPRFKKKLDVLDVKKTVFVPGTDRIIRPSFSLIKISNYCIFHRPIGHNLWKITSALYINERLKKMIQKEKLTGIEFEKAQVV